MTLQKHPDGRVEAVLQLAELVVEGKSVGGVATVEGSIVRALTQRVMTDAETIQSLTRQLHATMRALDELIQDTYYGDDEEGWD